MALSVATLAGFPLKNTTFQKTAGTPTDAATFSFTNGVYTQSGTQYVAGILDKEGVVPSRIFGASNGTGGGTGTSEILPTLVSITQVSAFGNSIQELPATTGEVAGGTGYAGFIIVISPAVATPTDGIYPLGYPGPVGWTAQGGAYTNASATVGYPQPQIRLYASMGALLILASTSTG